MVMSQAKRLLLIICGMLLAGGALAQAWPTKPITLLIPFPPGTGNDIIGRVLGAEMSKTLGQPVVAENRAGVSGNIAMEATAKAAPDGYTLVVGSTSYSINVYTLKGTAPLSAFTPVALIGKLPYTLMVSPQVPARDIKDLVALLKAKKGQYNGATVGPTGTSFFLTVALKQATGVELEIVPYKGTTEAVTDLLDGRVHILFAPMATAIPYYKSGKIKLHGTTGAKRNPLTPDVPSFIESGFPTLDVPSWYGFMGSAGIPRAIVNRINDAANKALATKDSLEKLNNIGIDPSPGTPDDFDAFLKQDSANWAKIVKGAGVTVQ